MKKEGIQLLLEKVEELIDQIRQKISDKKKLELKASPETLKELEKLEEIIKILQKNSQKLLEDSRKLLETAGVDIDPLRQPSLSKSTTDILKKTETLKNEAKELQNALFIAEERSQSDAKKRNPKKIRKKNPKKSTKFKSDVDWIPL